ncbi:MAG: CsgG/HfaB family protein [bacterium]
MRRSILLGVALLFVVAPLVAETELSPDVVKLAGLYNQGEFAEVVLQGVPLLDRPGLTHADSLKVVEILARSAAQDNKPDVAEKYLHVLITLDPNTDFNPRRMSTQFANVWYKVVQETGYVPGQKQKLVTVAVLEFSNGSFVDAEEFSKVGIGVASMLNYQLEESGALYCPSRENINYLLKELELSQSELVDQDQKVDIGKVIGVRNYIMGTFYNMPDGKFRIDARIVETETTLSKEHFSVEGKKDKIGELADQLAAEILAYLNVEAEKIKEASAKIPDVNLAALTKYSQAVAYEETGDTEAAAKAYAEALELSPHFSLADESQEGVKLDLAAKL